METKKMKKFNAQQIYLGQVAATQKLQAPDLSVAKAEAGSSPDPLSGASWWLDVKEIPEEN